MERKMLPDGPWNVEPEKLDWEAHGLKCAMRRNHFNAWCGYVGVDPAHPWFGLSYSDEVEQALPTEASVDEIGVMNIFCNALKGSDAEFNEIAMLIPCHGGITYSDKGRHIEESSLLWWFGFDCSHAGDFTPYEGTYKSADDVYRTAEYVKTATEKMALHLSQATGKTRDQLIKSLREKGDAP